MHMLEALLAIYPDIPTVHRHKRACSQSVIIQIIVIIEKMYESILRYHHHKAGHRISVSLLSSSLIQIPRSSLRLAS